MRALVLVVVAALCLSPACRCSRAAPEERARQAIDDVVSAAHRRDVKRMVAAVSEHYADAEGNRKEQIAALVRVQFLLHPNLYLVAKLFSLECPDPAQARVVIFAALASVPGGGLADLKNLAADVYRFDLSMVDEDGDWRVLRAAWAPATVGDLL